MLEQTMNNTWIIFCAAAAVALGVPTASAAAEAAEDTGPWSGRVLLGYLATSGNTDNTSANLEAGANWDGERWHHSLAGRAIGQSQQNSTTAESYKLTYEAKFDLTERTYLFGLIDHNKNRFSSYPEQTFEFVGVGRRFIKTDRHELNAEFGVGATQSDLQAILPDGTRVPAGSEDEFAWRASGDYKWTITDTSWFAQSLSVSSSSSNTFTESVTEVGANIIGALALVISYKVQNNSDVQPGTEKTDTFTAVNLEYAFGK
jgi:putative salt-induced outer membrane protein